MKAIYRTVGTVRKATITFAAMAMAIALFSESLADLNDTVVYSGETAKQVWAAWQSGNKWCVETTSIVHPQTGVKAHARYRCVERLLATATDSSGTPTALTVAFGPETGWLQTSEATQEISTIDSHLATWQSHLSDLYRYVKQDQNLLQSYHNDLNYKRQYDAWVQSELQRGRQSVQLLQAARDFFSKPSAVANIPTTPTPSSGGSAGGPGLLGVPMR